MDSELFKSSSSPRRELRGPRPAPLKVHKDSCKIKKPLVASLPQQRPPVIIYAVSPKVIHTNPSEFMSLVQRLTGYSSSSSSSSTTTTTTATTATTAISDKRGEVLLSPAAKLAMTELGSRSETEGEMTRKNKNELIDQIGTDSGTRIVDRIGSYPGILSPVTSSLPSISPNFFSPLTGVNFLNFLHELSPALQLHRDKKNFAGSNLASPSFMLSSPAMPSPTTYWEFFRQHPDL